MCQHSWYDKNRRHYGPKPNTRRARGLRRIDFGRKHGSISIPQSHRFGNIQQVERDTDVSEIAIPRRISTIKRYAKMYNWYVHYYQKYFDRKVAMSAVADKFNTTQRSVDNAIKVCKYILATTPVE